MVFLLIFVSFIIFLIIIFYCKLLSWFWIFLLLHLSLLSIILILFNLFLVVLSFINSNIIILIIGWLLIVPWVLLIVNFVLLGLLFLFSYFGGLLMGLFSLIMMLSFLLDNKRNWLLLYLYYLIMLEWYIIYCDLMA